MIKRVYPTCYLRKFHHTPSHHGHGKKKFRKHDQHVLQKEKGRRTVSIYFSPPSFIYPKSLNAILSFSISPPTRALRYDQARYGDINQRFINGCQGNMIEAQKRWVATVDWRIDEKIDDILSEPQPHFHDIKANYPHYYHGVGDIINQMHVFAR
jgi:hypothetical protein